VDWVLATSVAFRSTAFVSAIAVVIVVGRGRRWQAAGVDRIENVRGEYSY